MVVFKRTLVTENWKLFLDKNDTEKCRLEGLPERVDQPGTITKGSPGTCLNSPYRLIR